LDAFSNHCWPAVYIADAEGQIRFEHFGEGQYEECEHVIHRLLRDAGAAGVDDESVSVADQGFEAQADWANLGSPETYLGYAQAQNLPVSAGVELELNEWGLAGDWTVDSRASVADRVRSHHAPPARRRRMVGA
jgi:hypothetical protein